MLVCRSRKLLPFMTSNDTPGRAPLEQVCHWSPAGTEGWLQEMPPARHTCTGRHGEGKGRERRGGEGPATDTA